jgi:hypothetical protein
LQDFPIYALFSQGGIHYTSCDDLDTEPPKKSSDVFNVGKALNSWAKQGGIERTMHILGNLAKLYAEDIIGAGAVALEFVAEKVKHMLDDTSEFFYDGVNLAIESVINLTAATVGKIIGTAESVVKQAIAILDQVFQGITGLTSEVLAKNIHAGLSACGHAVGIIESGLSDVYGSLVSGWTWITDGIEGFWNYYGVPILKELRFL